VDSCVIGPRYTGTALANMRAGPACSAGQSFKPKKEGSEFSACLLLLVTLRYGWLGSTCDMKFPVFYTHLLCKQHSF